MIDEKALFLGPYGENKEYFQQLVQLLIEDVAGWRNNYHPNDDRAILPADKRKEDFKITQDKLYASLNRLLAEMKQSVPIHSPRYLGHMLSDVLTSALLGYFAGLIYNQNNVVGEVSTVTTRKEMEFSAALCKMIGYEPYDKYKNGSWAHLTSGGSTAIMEAMWIARNMKYYPLSVKLLLNDAKINSSKYSDVPEINLINEIKVKLPNGSEVKFENIDLFTLFNLSTQSVADFKDNIVNAIAGKLTVDESDIELLGSDDLKKKRINKANKFLNDVISDFLVQNLGVAGIHLEIKKIFNEDLALPKLYISQTAHYSWEKNMDIIGIGKSNIIKIKTGTDFKIDLKDLEDQITQNKNSAILMVTGITGTTEESAIDPVVEMIKFKENLEKRNNKSFYFKIDGAWGGYYLTMLKDGENKSPETDKYFNENKKYYQTIEKDLLAIKHSDSVVIDPHKMGYIPYAVGAVCYKDTRYKEFIYKAAPYLATSNEDDFMERSYLGGWTVEGSRSGAAALACSLSADVLPLDRTGYGKLILQTIKSATELYDCFDRSINSDIKIIPVYKPQGNIVCFLVSAPDYIKRAKYLNTLNQTVFDEMSVMPDKNLPVFLTSKTELSYNKYQDVINKLFEAAGVEKSVGKDFKELLFLRTVTMNPMLNNYEVTVREGNTFKKEPLFKEFIKEIEKIGQKALSSLLLQIINDYRTGSETDKRLKIYWIENKPSFNNLQNLLKTDLIKGMPAIGKYLDITFENYQGEKPLERIKETIENRTFDFSVIDLNLIDSHHKEWQSGLEVVKTLYSDNSNRAGIPILFSQFFDDENTAVALKNQFKTYYPDVFKNEKQFLAKNNNIYSEKESELAAIQELIKRIFVLSQ